MIRSETVLIVGAGASCELGFPSGTDLLAKVANALDIRFDHFSQKYGSPGVMHAYRAHHALNNPEEDINNYLHAGWRLRDAARIARSIDNALDQNSGDPKLELAGKLAISEQIIKSEKSSKIKSTDRDANLINLSNITDTWLFQLGQILTTDVRRNEIEEIFEKIKIITFNYDRSIEKTVPTFLRDAYGLNVEESLQLARKLEIFHPYGYLGKLPDQYGHGGISYGSSSYDLTLLAQGIKTFGEEIEKNNELVAMRNFLGEAKRIVFLGFGYHRPNMSLLSPNNGLTAGDLYGTVFAESNAAIDTIRGDLKKMAVGINGLNFPIEPKLIDLTCSDFLKQHYLPLTA